MDQRRLNHCTACNGSAWHNFHFGTYYSHTSSMPFCCPPLPDLERKSYNYYMQKLQSHLGTYQLRMFHTGRSYQQRFFLRHTPCSYVLKQYFHPGMCQRCNRYTPFRGSPLHDQDRKSCSYRNYRPQPGLDTFPHGKGRTLSLYLQMFGPCHIVYNHTLLLHPGPDIAPLYKRCRASCCYLQLHLARKFYMLQLHYFDRCIFPLRMPCKSMPLALLCRYANLRHILYTMLPRSLCRCTFLPHMLCMSMHLSLLCRYATLRHSSCSCCTQ